MLKALVWDVDGTIAETERDGHRVAFNQALKEFGVPWRWDVQTYARLLRVTGGFERLLFDMEGRAEAPTTPHERERLARAVHRRKNSLYASMVEKGRIAARPGVRRVMDECEGAGILLAIATTTSRSNVDALFASLFGAEWKGRFVAVVCAEDAPAKKPDPLAYRMALERASCAPDQVLAVEDSPNGMKAAAALGIGTLVTRSEFFMGEAFPQAACVCNDLDGAATVGQARVPRIDVDALRAIHAGWVGAGSGQALRDASEKQNIIE